MGQLYSCCLKWFVKNRNTPEPEEKKLYSWEVRKTKNREDYLVENVESTTIIKKPGDIDGEQFGCRNLKKCNILLFDHVATIMIDDCEDCFFIVGPVHQSIFLRDCHDCSIIVACQQFRVRDCYNIKVMLHSDTKPIIESSNNIYFSCYRLTYSDIAEHFIAAKLSPFNNNWFKVYDFSARGDNGDIGPNWKLIHSNQFDLESKIEKSLIDEVNISLKCTFVPLTKGTTDMFTGNSCLVVFLPQSDLLSSVLRFTAECSSKADIIVVQTKKVKLSCEDFYRVFPMADKSYKQALKSPDDVISVEVNGAELENCINICKEIGPDVCSNGMIYYSSLETSTENIDKFYSFVDMHIL